MTRSYGGICAHLNHALSEASAQETANPEGHTAALHELGAAAGDFVHTPKGLVHTYVTVGTTTDRLFCPAVPAGIERFLVRWANPLAARPNQSRHQGNPLQARSSTPFARHISTALRSSCRLRLSN
jgi:hypothetical protein